MGHSMMLQDWTTAQGTSSTVIQNASDYLDVSGYQDVAVYLEISQMQNVGFGGAAMNLSLETSPTKDEVLFNSNAPSGNPYLINYNFTVVPALGVQSIQYSLWATATDKVLARYLRWKVAFGTGAQSITFRVWLNLNQAGWV
jgi:hypothetical protein